MNPWILACRPKTILASIGPVLIGLAIAYLINGKLNMPIAIITLICAILLQIATNIANDYLDFKKGVDTKERLGPIRVTSQGLISPEKMQKALIMILALALMLGTFLMYYGGIYIIIIGFLSLYFSYGYTGGPFPLSYNGLGEISALIFFGPIAVTGTTYLQTMQFDYLSGTLGLGVGFLAAAILAINNLRDLDTDKKNGKKTIAVIFGEKFQRYLIISSVTISVLISLIVAIYLKNYLMPLTVVIFLIFSSNWKGILNNPISENLNNNLAKTAQYLFIYSIIISLSIVILR